MRRLLVLVVTAVAAAAAAVVGPTVPASAGGGDVDVDLVSPVEPLTLEVEIVGEVVCEVGVFEVVSVVVDGTEIEPISVTVLGDDPAALVVLPSDTPPGLLEIEVTCEAGPEPETLVGFLSLRSMPVTKVVDGTPPAGTTFTVHVDCEFVILNGIVDPDIEVDLEYGATGGVRYVYFERFALCEITEPNDGGAATTTITPDFVEIDPPDLYPVTVTNTFVAPAVVEPRFTG